MTTAEIAGLVALGIVFVLLLASGVSRLVLHLMRGPLETRIAADYRADEIVMKDVGANTFGLESKGAFQGRGNGALVLTKDCLHFYRFVSGGDLRVPLDAITEISFTKSHLGKATIFDFARHRRVDPFTKASLDPRLERRSPALQEFPFATAAFRGDPDA